MLMLPDAANRTVGDANVEHESAAIGHHVDVERPHFGWEALSPTSFGGRDDPAP